MPLTGLPKKTTSKQRKVANAIIAVLVEEFHEDPDVAEASVTPGDQYGWGAEAAMITTENGLYCLHYYDSDWIGNSIKIQQGVYDRTRIKIFIECYNPAVHNVYWAD